MSNTLKVRDDHAPICFEASAADVGKFKLCEGAEASWLTQSQTFGIKELRSRVEPWLTALFQSEHLSLLAGSGLTHAIHHLATGEPAAGMGEATLTSYNACSVSDIALRSDPRFSCRGSLAMETTR